MQWELEERWISATAWWDWLMRPRPLMLAGPSTSGNNAIGSCCKWFVTAVIAMYSELKLAEPWWYQGHPRAMDEKKTGPEWLTPHFQHPVSTHFQHRRTSNTQRTHSQRPKVTHFQHKKQVSASVARQFQYLPHYNTLEFVWKTGEGSFYLHNYWHQPFRVVNDSATHTDRIQQRTQPKLSHTHRINSARHTGPGQPRTQIYLSHTHRIYSAIHTKKTQPSHTHTRTFICCS